MTSCLGIPHMIMWCSVHKLLCSALKISASFQMASHQLYIILRDLWADTTVLHQSRINLSQCLSPLLFWTARLLINPIPGHRWLLCMRCQHNLCSGCTWSGLQNSDRCHLLMGVRYSSLTCSWTWPSSQPNSECLASTEIDSDYCDM